MFGVCSMTYVEEQLHNLAMIEHYSELYYAEYHMPGRHRDEDALAEYEQKLNYYLKELEDFLNRLVEEEQTWINNGGKCSENCQVSS